jgi:hypothetical protein
MGKRKAAAQAPPRKARFMRLLGDGAMISALHEGCIQFRYGLKNA